MQAMFGAKLTVGLGIAIAVLLVSLGISMKMNGSKSEKIGQLEAALQQSAVTISAQKAQLDALSKGNDADVAKAAEQCAQQGSSSYLRGVEVGKAIGARQCAA